MSQSQLKRRKFLKVAGAAALGFSSTRCSLASAKTAFQYIPFIAEVLGYGFAAKTIHDYLKDKPQGVRSAFADVVEKMARGGFTGQDSKAYQAKDKKFCHAVENVNGVDACLAFYTQDNFITMVEGPTIIGVTHAAREVRSGLSRDIAKQLFAPVSSASNSGDRGRLESGYSVASIYENLSGGLVEVTYKLKQAKAGEVRVKAKSGPGLILPGQEVATSPIDFDRRYDIDWSPTQAS